MKLLLLIGVVAFAATSNAVVPANSVARSVDTFSNNIVKAIVDDVSKNLVCSPISAHMVLSMAAFGARGYTKNIMRSALGLNGNDAVTKNEFQSLIDKWTNSPNYELRLANKVFVSARTTLTPEFVRTTKTAFRSQARKLDFGNPSAASKVINDWTALQTKDLIKNIVKSSDLNNSTSLVLVNAIYFKGNWEKEFDEELTAPRPFYVNGRYVRNVPTMYRREVYRYGELSDVNAKFIEVPYQINDYDDGVSMFFILPNEINGISQLIQNFDKVTVQRLQQRMYRYRTVDAYLPKFKIESSIDLQTPLTKLGLRHIFSDAANFAGIVNPSNLAISKIMQKAFIAVDEHGTVAAAATDAGFEDRSGGGHTTPVDFIADHPFIAVIATTDGVPLFSAVVSEPIF